MTFKIWTIVFNFNIKSIHECVLTVIHGALILQDCSDCFASEFQDILSCWHVSHGIVCYKVLRLGGFLGHPKHDLLESWNQPFQPMGILNIPRSTEKSFDSDNVSPPVPASVTRTHGCCVIRPDVEVKDITKRLDLAPELWIGLLNGLEQRDTTILRGWRFWSTWGTCVFASCSTFFASSLTLKPLFEFGSSETKCE